MTGPVRSQSAEMVAMVRAAHQLIDDEPLILRDPLALRIIGADGERWLRDNRTLLDVEYMRRMRGMVTIRSRVCEDELRRSVDGGRAQYVVLGAGLDTFAYRAADLADRLTVYEVDQPATQQWKRERLLEAGIEVPRNARFVPLDFNDGALGPALAGAGFDRAVPAFFAWLGVSYYLPRESALEVLRFIAGHRAASGVVFDFAVDAAGVPAGFQHLYRELRRHMLTSREPWQTWFVPDELVATLVALGFDAVTHMDASASQACYLDGRTDGLLPGPLVGLISARRWGA